MMMSGVMSTWYSTAHQVPVRNTETWRRARGYYSYCINRKVAIAGTAASAVWLKGRGSSMPHLRRHRAEVHGSGVVVQRVPSLPQQRVGITTADVNARVLFGETNMNHERGPAQRQGRKIRSRGERAGTKISYRYEGRTIYACTGVP